MKLADYDRMFKEWSSMPKEDKRRSFLFMQVLCRYLGGEWDEWTGPYSGEPSKEAVELVKSEAPRSIVELMEESIRKEEVKAEKEMCAGMVGATVRSIVEKLEKEYAEVYLNRIIKLKILGSVRDEAMRSFDAGSSSICRASVDDEDETTSFDVRVVSPRKWMVYGCSFLFSFPEDGSLKIEKTSESWSKNKGELSWK